MKILVLLITKETASAQGGEYFSSLFSLDGRHRLYTSSATVFRHAAEKEARDYAKRQNLLIVNSHKSQDSFTIFWKALRLVFS